MLATVALLSHTPASAAASGIQALTDAVLAAEAITAGVDVGLLAAGGALLGTYPASRAELQGELQAAIAEQNEETFPLNAFMATAVADVGPCPNLAAYVDALDHADRESARLAPLLAAVLAVEELAGLDHPVGCPVCATPNALTPARIAALRDQLRRSTAVDTAAAAASDVIQKARQDLDRVLITLPATVPAVGTWLPEQLATAAAQLRRLGVDNALAAPAQATPRVLLLSQEVSGRPSRPRRVRSIRPRETLGPGRCSPAILAIVTQH